MFAECYPVICHLIDDGKGLDPVALGSQSVSAHLEALLYRCNTAYKSSTCLTDYIYKPGKCASVSKEVIDYKNAVIRRKVFLCNYDIVGNSMCKGLDRSRINISGNIRRLVLLLKTNQQKNGDAPRFLFLLGFDEFFDDLNHLIEISD